MLPHEHLRAIKPKLEISNGASRWLRPIEDVDRLRVPAGPVEQKFRCGSFRRDHHGRAAQASYIHGFAKTKLNLCNQQPLHETGIHLFNFCYKC